MLSSGDIESAPLTSGDSANEDAGVLSMSVEDRWWRLPREFDDPALEAKYCQRRIPRMKVVLRAVSIFNLTNLAVVTLWKPVIPRVGGVELPEAALTPRYISCALLAVLLLFTLGMGMLTRPFIARHFAAVELAIDD